MAITVSFGTFTKKINSTARGTMTATYACLLKEPCTAQNPIVVLQLDSNPSSYNVAYIADFNRYYWIRRWEYDKGLWTAYMKCDTLATYKPYIGNTNLYVTRSSTAFDGTVPDNQITTKGVTVNSTAIRNPFTTTNGSYIIGVLQSPGTFGGKTLFKLSPILLNSFLDFLQDDTKWKTPGSLGEWYNELADAIMRIVLQPTKYIVSAFYFPFDVTATGGEVTFFPGFNHSTDLPTAPTLSRTNASQVIDCSFPLSNHPQINDFGDFLNYSPYKKIYIHLPGFGMIPIPATEVAGSSTIDVKINCDIITGRAKAFFFADTDNLITVAYGKVGVPVTLSQETAEPMEFTASIGSAIGETASGGVNPAGAIFGATKIINSVKEYLDKPLLTVGGNGGLAEFTAAPAITEIFANVTESSKSVNGRPLNAIRKPDTLAGSFIVADNPSVPLPATDEELEEVRQFLSTGFFYE